MKELFAALAAFCFMVAAAVAAEKPNQQNLQPSLFAGEIQKLPKKGREKESFCGEYFIGRTNAHPDEPVAFFLKMRHVDKDGEKADFLPAIAMTKKNIIVVMNNKKAVPWAQVMVINGVQKVELQISLAELARAKCLPRPAGTKTL